MRTLLLTVAVGALAGCALFSKGEVATRRYYSVQRTEPVSAPPTAHSGKELRLGRVTSSASLTERIMFRLSDHEVGFYEDRLWTEKPEASLRRALSWALFEQQGLRSVVRGGGPTLAAELVSFEEVRTPVHLSRVRIVFSLSDERVVTLQQTLTVERPIPAAKGDAEAGAIADAMGDSLREAVREISSQVASSLEATAAVK